MTIENFGDRGRAMEDSFFRRRDQELLASMRSELEAKAARDALAAVSGITDERLLDALVEIGVRAETLACVSLIPMVAVAWADGKLDEPERNAILRAVREKGLPGNALAEKLVAGWLTEPPGDGLLATWTEYVQVLARTLEGSQLARLEQDVLTRAKEVADAAGGFLGVLNRTSRSEQLVLEQLAAPFRG